LARGNGETEKGKRNTASEKTKKKNTPSGKSLFNTRCRGNGCRTNKKEPRQTSLRQGQEKKTAICFPKLNDDSGDEGEITKRRERGLCRGDSKIP